MSFITGYELIHLTTTAGLGFDITLGCSFPSAARLGATMAWLLHGMEPLWFGCLGPRGKAQEMELALKVTQRQLAVSDAAHQWESLPTESQ